MIPASNKARVPTTDGTTDPATISFPSPGPGFLRAYFDALPSLPGWFSPDAAFMFLAYNQVISAQRVEGNVLEIGVHHGKSALLVAALRSPGGGMLAIDLFEDLQDQNVSGSGGGSKATFFGNVRYFHGDISWLRIIAGNSRQLGPAQIGSGYSFCHVDGGHSAEETFHDLQLCADASLPGGLIALDDYFNPSFPEVCEGALRYARAFPANLTPLAIGYNKVLFQKRGLKSGETNTRFTELFPAVPKRPVRMWGVDTWLFDSGVTPYFDVDASTPNHLRPARLSLSASIRPSCKELAAPPECEVRLPVFVTNTSAVPLPSVCGLSYHLLAVDGTVMAWDHPRSYFQCPLQIGESRECTILLRTPAAPGTYLVALDVVWEGLAWLMQQWHPDSTITLSVTQSG